MSKAVGLFAAIGLLTVIALFGDKILEVVNAISQAVH